MFIASRVTFFQNLPHIMVTDDVTPKGKVKPCLHVRL